MRKPVARAWYGYMYVWLGLQALWLLWLLPDTEGWRRLVTLVLAVGLVVCIGMIERDRRRGTSTD